MKEVLLCLVFVAVQTLWISAGWTADKVVEKPVAADTPEKFTQTVEQIRKEMTPGGRYEFIHPGDKAKVETDLNSMAAMLQKSGSVAAMNLAEKTQLFNTQEHVNGILTHSDRDRLVCESNAPTGSNLRRMTCQTVGEIESNRRAAQKSVEDASLTGNKCMGQASCKSH